MLLPLPCLADYKHTAETEQLGKRPDRGPVQPRAGHGHPDAPRRRHRLAPRVRVSLKLTFLKLLFKSSHLFSHHLVLCSCFMLVKFLKTNVFPLKLHFISPHILDINHLWSKHFKTEKNIIIITCTWIFWLFFNSERELRFMIMAVRCFGNVKTIYCFNKHKKRYIKCWLYSEFPSMNSCFLKN